MIQRDQPQGLNPSGPKCQRLFTHPRQPAVFGFLSESWTWLLTYGWRAITAHSHGRFIDTQRLPEPRHDTTIRPTGWLISYNKNQSRSWHLLPSVCSTLSYSNEAISARLLLIIHVSVICAAVHSHLEEEEGSSDPFLQVKRLMQIHPVSVNTCLNSSSVRLLMLPCQSIEIFCLLLHLSATDMSPKSFLFSWFNPQHCHMYHDIFPADSSGSLPWRCLLNGIYRQYVRFGYWNI